MQLTTYVTELRDSLTAAASLGDENSQKSAAALAAALEPATRMMLLHALSDMATEVTAQLAATASSGSEQIAVDVRLDGRDVRVAVTRTGGTQPDAEAGESAGAADDANSTGPDSSGEGFRGPWGGRSHGGPGGWFGGAGFGGPGFGKPGFGSPGKASADATNAGPDSGPGRGFADASGDLTRTTVRMFNELKDQAERAASDQGMSLNAFISRAVSESIRGRGRQQHPHRQSGGGHSINGFVQG